jgi:hypothetical protein
VLSAVWIFAFVFVTFGLKAPVFYASRQFTYFPPDRPPGTFVNDMVEWPRVYYHINHFVALLLLLSAVMLAACRARVSSFVAVTAVGSFAFVFFGIAGVSSIFLYRTQANTPGHSAGNMADDRRKCCVPEFYNFPEANGCPLHVRQHSNAYPLAGISNVGGCEGSLSTLTLS